ncbi:MAG: SoxR reducing system RseC family protein [Pseudomonadota bacterium]|uniref:SoxR reducing system RseC family protein n=1 Tax=Candidatus Desulfatibia profunda TaxID=2841695 RepID=A0A8J6TLP3_9BACT|nr:SoxR reducing system RseC family protein [Candidatus Desulfatibia profunda]MBL7180814.1 SoxR reducing system RseC family protein [Desulfobacterales bacterium]MBU0699317.1 SoxR reducing system RseC family protein [Pseudomonadota bacterium]
MATEEGVVIRIGAGTAWVKTTKSKACEGCSSKGACSVMGGGDDMEVQAINAAGGKVGDRVVLSFDTTPLLKATFLIYVFPILCMLAGALIGMKLAPAFNLGTSTASAIGGFSFLALAFIYVKSKGDRMSRQDQYRPKVIRVLRQQ